ncbi:hypothetical protein ACJW30_02G142900 [Castanea mollissima]
MALEIEFTVHTRKIIDAIHSGSLSNANYKKTEVSGSGFPQRWRGAFRNPGTSEYCKLAILTSLPPAFLLLGLCLVHVIYGG